MIHPIRVWGDPCLRAKAAPVTSFDSELSQVADSLLDTMTHAGGVGLAANQIGVLLQLIAFELPEWEPTPAGAPRRGVLVNPALRLVEGEELFELEGCLSIPGVEARVRRRALVEVAALDVHGEPLTLHASGLFSRIMQHERDHLDGILFLDRLDGPEKAHKIQEALRAATPGTAS